MYTLRLLVLPLLIAICGAPLAAQSAPEKKPAQVLPPRPQDAPAVFVVGSPRLSPDGRNLSDIIRPEMLEPILPPNCYRIRTYRVTREDPESDVTRPAGYSSCQPGALFGLKIVGDSRAQASFP